MTDPNPFNGTDSLKNVVDAVSEIISGQPVIPDQFNSHIDAAAEEIAAIEGPTTNDDITKIVQKHFNTASEGVPQETKLQTAFQNEIANKVAQNNAAKKWEEH